LEAEVENDVAMKRMCVEGIRLIAVEVEIDERRRGMEYRFPIVFEGEVAVYPSRYASDGCEV
jgi:hypothetical protein